MGRSWIRLNVSNYISVVPAASIMSEEETLLAEADTLYAEHNVDALYDLLVEKKDSNNADVLWRLARAACDKGKSLGKEPDRRKFINEAFEYIKKALTITEENSAVHKWYGILLDYVGEYEGTKERMTNSPAVK